MDRPRYIEWLVKEEGVELENGVQITCYSIDYKVNDEYFDDWALHIRRHYISDEDLKRAEIDLNLSPEDYLRTFVIPQSDETYGPVARSNDLTEILIADILEYIDGYQAPRCKQYNRSGKNLSEHGTDIIAYKYFKDDKKANPNDELLAVEVKAALTSQKCDVVENAIIDSQKDEVRFAHTLDYYRKTLEQMNKSSEAKEIARFQNKAEISYKTSYIAAAVSSIVDIPQNVILGISQDVLTLTLKESQKVYFVHGRKLMDLAHQIFERCTK